MLAKRKIHITSITLIIITFATELSIKKSNIITNYFKGINEFLIFPTETGTDGEKTHFFEHNADKATDKAMCVNHAKVLCRSKPNEPFQAFHEFYSFKSY